MVGKYSQGSASVQRGGAGGRACPGVDAGAHRPADRAGQPPPLRSAPGDDDRAVLPAQPSRRTRPKRSPGAPVAAQLDHQLVQRQALGDEGHGAQQGLHIDLALLRVSDDDATPLLARPAGALALPSSARNSVAGAMPRAPASRRRLSFDAFVALLASHARQPQRARNGSAWGLFFSGLLHYPHGPQVKSKEHLRPLPPQEKFVTHSFLLLQKDWATPSSC